MTEQATETTVTPNEPPEAYSMEEIATLAEGKPLEAAEPEPEAEEAEEVDDSTSDEGAEDDGGEVEEVASDAEAEERPAKKAKPRYVRKEERDRLATQRDELRDRAAMLEEDNRRQREMIDKLIGAASPAEAEAAAEDDDILDEVAFRKTNKRIDEVEQRVEASSYVTQIKSDFAALGDAAPIVGGAIAYLQDVGVFERAIKDGRDPNALTKDQREKYLVQVNKEMDMEGLAQFKAGKNPLEIALKTAVIRGFAPAAAKGAAKKESTVNMQAVDRARKEAGAPTHVRESVKVEGGDWMNDMYKTAKESGASDSYMKKMFG